MRAILHISLPERMAEAVRDEVKEGNYGSVSEFFRDLVREWQKQRSLADIRISEEEFKEGKAKVLRSLTDLR